MYTIWMLSGIEVINDVKKKKKQNFQQVIHGILNKRAKIFLISKTESNILEDQFSPCHIDLGPSYYSKCITAVVRVILGLTPRPEC